MIYQLFWNVGNELRTHSYETQAMLMLQVDLLIANGIEYMYVEIFREK